jgi:hypothetical protein
VVGGGRRAAAPGGATVAEARVRRPKLLAPTATAHDVRDLFRDDHVHAALVFDDERLITVIEPGDVETSSDDVPARTMGTLWGRTVAPYADLWSTWVWMTTNGRRRLAVIEDGRSVGLLCLKRSGRGFCCDAGIQARALLHTYSTDPTPPPHTRQEPTWDE